MALVTERAETCSARSEEKVRIEMNWKPKLSWRATLYSLAALAVLALAAGARYKPR